MINVNEETDKVLMEFTGSHRERLLALAAEKRVSVKHWLLSSLIAHLDGSYQRLMVRVLSGNGGTD